MQACPTPPARPHLRAYRVQARVRREGSVGDYYRREFRVMLAEDTPARMARAARACLHQLGYQTRAAPHVVGLCHEANDEAE